MSECNPTLEKRPRGDWLLRCRSLGLPCLLVAATIIVYANSLDGVFLFDDSEHIVNNAAIRQFWPITTVARSAASRPLLPISLAANYTWGGLDVTGYHVFNIGVHLVAGLALFGLVRGTLRLPSLGDRFTTSADGIAFAAALLWLVHPLQTQAVTYIVQRCESMMGMFFLLTMYAYLRGSTCRVAGEGVNRGGRGRFQAWFWYSVALVCYCLGLASKEVMAMVLPVLLVYDRVFLSGSWRDVFRARVGLYAAFSVPLLAAASIIVPAMFSGARSTVGFEIESVAPWEYARSQPGVILHYLRLVFVPYPQCLDYGWPIETRWLVGILLADVLLFGLLIGSVYDLWRGGAMGFLGLAFFLILAPTSSIMPIQDLCFEHRMYLPLACVVTGVVLLAWMIVKRLPSHTWRCVAVGALVAATVVLGGLTVARNQVYRSAIAIWTDVVEKTRAHREPSDLGRALNNLADELLVAGQYEDGVDVLREAVRLNPRMAQIHGNLGRGLCELGKYDEARRYCEEAVRREPTGARYRQQLGLLAAAQQQWEEAERELREAARLAPRDDVVQTNLGQCLVDQGKHAEAIVCFQQVVQRDPHAIDARQRLAMELASAGRFDEAAAQATTLTEVSPGDARPHLLLGLIEVQRGDEASALRHFTRAVEVDPESAAAHLQVGNVQRRLGNPGQAQRSYEMAVRLDDALAEAHNNLGGLFAEEESARAVRHFSKAIKSQSDFLQARFNLAATLTRLKRYQEAVEQYDAVLRIQPDHAPAKANRQELVARLAATQRRAAGP